MSTATYQQIIDLVQDCVRRMQDAGESHRMLARWISEGIDALSASPAQPVAIKPLEWERNEAGTWYAASPMGTYLVNQGRWWRKGRTPLIDVGHDAAAKAAAQSDYEARIRSALSVPLPEIEGGDGAETITESAGRRRTELAIAEYLKVRDESMGTPDADNAERLQSAKDIHSLVIRQQGTRTRLSERNAAMLAAPSASIEGETP